MGETGAVDVLEGGERDTNNLLSCSHYPLKGLAAGRVAGAIPHSDAASQDHRRKSRGGRGGQDPPYLRVVPPKNII